MLITQRQQITLGDFLDLPEGKPAHEYLDGVVTQKVSPKGPHSRLQSKLCELFNSAAEPRKLGIAFPELRTVYSGSAPVPDVSYYRWDRIPRDQNGDIADDFLEPPDIAIEILSPGQSRTTQLDRCRWYVEHGARVALLVDPGRRAIHEARAGGEYRILRGDDVVDLSDVIPDVQFTVRELFDLLNPR